MERTVILYHGGCPDGFGGAYAAWKKFGDSAEYVALRHQKPAPDNLVGAHLYFIDFCFPKEQMDELISVAASVTVLDHHEGVRGVVEAMPEFVYEVSHSGATIAWSYFHPGTEVPLMLRYVEDGDLYKFALPDSRPLLAYLYSNPFEFGMWDTLVEEVADDAKRLEMVRRGEIFKEHADSLIRQLAERASLVRFEGYEVYFSSSISAFSSDLANLLARKQAPLALAVQARPDGLRVSLRGDGSVNVAELAQKYGGNGHPNSAAFSLPWGAPLPWEKIENEDTGD
jgi:nanoRNase/pAp phosphatase (c-di-AMP/oligoRNAs hydrolase)